MIKNYNWGIRNSCFSREGVTRKVLLHIFESPLDRIPSGWHCSAWLLRYPVHVASLECGLQIRPKRVCQVSIDVVLFILDKEHAGNMLVYTRLSVYRTILSKTFHETIQMKDESIGRCHCLKRYTVKAFTSTVRSSLMSFFRSWNLNFNPIDESNTVGSHAPLFIIADE